MESPGATRDRTREQTKALPYAMEHQRPGAHPCWSLRPNPDAGRVIEERFRPGGFVEVTKVSSFMLVYTPPPPEPRLLEVRLYYFGGRQDLQYMWDDAGPVFAPDAPIIRLHVRAIDLRDLNTSQPLYIPIRSTQPPMAATPTQDEKLERLEKLTPVYVDDLRIGAPADKGSAEPYLPVLWSLLSRRTHDGAPASEDGAAKVALELLEKKWGVTIPPDLKTIASWAGIEEAVYAAFPTNNDFVSPTEGWELLRVADTDEHAVRFMDENQGCCYWFAAWKDGDTRCRVYVAQYPDLYGPPDEDSDEEATEREKPSLTANSLAAFYADYAKSGAEWYTEHAPLKEGVDKRTHVDAETGMKITVFGDASQFDIDEKGNLAIAIEDSSDEED